MKKILMLSTTFILFFCLGLKKTAKADAYYEFYEIHETTPIETPFAITLPQGYYVMSAFPYSISRNNFKGDCIIEEVAPKTEVELEDIKKTGSLELSETALQEDLLDYFNAAFCHINEVGAIVVKVNSSAVYYSDVDYRYDITTIALITEQLDGNSNYAGNRYHFTSIENPISLNQLKSRYTAEDNVDGNISSRIVLDTNYDPDHARLGTFYVSIKVKDSANNETSIFDVIQCDDFIPPKIEFLDGLSEINVEVNSGFNIKSLRDRFIVTDNYASESQISKSYTDIDCYESNPNKLGTYKYRISARDQSYNFGYATLTFHIVDTTKPTITLKGGGNAIYADHVLTDGEIKALFEVSDNYSNLTLDDLKIVSNTCVGKEGVEYKLTLSITDTNNNKQEQTFNYYLMDTQSPIIRVEKTLFLPLGEYFTNQMILNKLKEAGIISQDATNVSFTYDESITKKAGCYEIQYVETTKDGKTIEGSVVLNVFVPYKTESSKFNNLNYLWFLLLIIPAIVGATILYRYKINKHEKM